jgi:hypothetical protein
VQAAYPNYLVNLDYLLMIRDGKPIPLNSDTLLFVFRLFEAVSEAQQRRRALWFVFRFLCCRVCGSPHNIVNLTLLFAKQLAGV